MWPFVRWPGFSELLVHELVIEPDDDLRPGERLLVPTTSLHGPRLTADHARQDFVVRVGRNRSRLAGVCLGPERDRGTPERRISYVHDPNHMKGLLTSECEGRSIGRQDALGMRIDFPASVLIDWHLTYAGWAYVVGVLVRRGDDFREVLNLAGRALDTWQWLPPRTRP